MLRRLIVKPFGNPDFYYRLPGYAKPSRFFVKRVHHPRREIDIHSALFLVDTPGGGKIEMFKYIVAIIKFFIEFSCFPPPLSSVFSGKYSDTP